MFFPRGLSRNILSLHHLFCIYFSFIPVTGFPTWAVIILIGAVCIVYTTLVGGISCHSTYPCSLINFASSESGNITVTSWDNYKFVLLKYITLMSRNSMSRVFVWLLKSVDNIVLDSDSDSNVDAI